MVFHFLNNIFDPSNFSLDNNTQVRQLVSEGFTAQEAEQLSWLENHRNRGKYYGIATGLFTVYTCKKVAQGYAKTYFPRLVYQPVAGFFAQAAVVYTFYLAFDYLYTSNRYASNNKFTNHTIFSNRVFQESKQHLVQHFEPVNRKFSQTEIEQFKMREESISDKKGQRNFIYNPHVHGEDEQAWKDHVNFLYEQNKRATEDHNVKAQILEENKDKVYNGEELVYEPFNTIENVDKTGTKHSLFKFFLFNKWQPIF